MIAEEYLSRSRLFRRLRNGPYGSYVELYASRLIRIGLSLGIKTTACQTEAESEGAKMNQVNARHEIRAIYREAAR